MTPFPLALLLLAVVLSLASAFSFQPSFAFKKRPEVLAEQKYSNFVVNYPFSPVSSLLRMTPSDYIDDDGFANDEETRVATGDGEVDKEQGLEGALPGEDDEEDDDEEEEDEEIEGFRLSAVPGLSMDGDDDDTDAATSDEFYELEDDEESEETSVKRVPKDLTLAARRSKRNKSIRTRRTEQSWEEKYLDDPLKSDEPTRDLDVQPTDGYSTMFVAVGKVAELSKRGEVWLHHQQWGRRNTLLPKGCKIHSEFTLLARNRLAPAAQLLLVRANQSTEVSSLLESEPIAANGGLGQAGWSLYEMGGVDTELYENCTNHLRDPFIYIGEVTKGIDSVQERQHLKYHDSSDRVGFIGRLTSTTGGDKDKVIVAFNAPTHKDAARYIEADPLVSSGHLTFDENADLSPCNEQDVDGMHHFMARTFGEKTEFDKLHYLDPEDLLEIEADPSKVPHLNTLVENRLVLDELAAQGISYRYDRYNMQQRFGNALTDKDAALFNEFMAQAQKSRLGTAVEERDETDEIFMPPTDADYDTEIIYK